MLPPDDQVSQRICTDLYDQQTKSWQVPAGMSASICQTLGEAAATGTGPAASHSICLNGTLNNVQVGVCDSLRSSACVGMLLSSFAHF